MYPQYQPTSAQNPEAVNTIASKVLGAGASHQMLPPVIKSAGSQRVASLGHASSSYAATPQHATLLLSKGFHSQSSLYRSTATSAVTPSLSTPGRHRSNSDVKFSRLFDPCLTTPTSVHSNRPAPYRNASTVTLNSSSSEEEDDDDNDSTFSTPSESSEEDSD